MATLINLNNNSRYYDENQTEWHRRRLQQLEDKYSNGGLKLSPQLHKLVYGIRPPNNYEITDDIIQHIRIIHVPAGGLNSNDYIHIPIEFRRHFWKIVKDFPVPKTCEDAGVFFEWLDKKYNIDGGLEQVLLYYYMNDIERLMNDANS
tara:strand:+ start:975 stop:1418 length:444 start_codon:yes stop_codon:yes gene_type:complete